MEEKLKTANAHDCLVALNAPVVPFKELILAKLADLGNTDTTAQASENQRLKDFLVDNIIATQQYMNPGMDAASAKAKFLSMSVNDLQVKASAATREAFELRQVADAKKMDSKKLEEKLQNLEAAVKGNKLSVLSAGDTSTGLGVSASGAPVFAAEKRETMDVKVELDPFIVSANSFSSGFTRNQPDEHVVAAAYYKNLWEGLDRTAMNYPLAIRDTTVNASVAPSVSFGQFAGIANASGWDTDIHASSADSKAKMDALHARMNKQADKKRMVIKRSRLPGFEVLMTEKAAALWSSHATSAFDRNVSDIVLAPAANRYHRQATNPARDSFLARVGDQSYSSSWTGVPGHQ